MFDLNPRELSVTLWVAVGIIVMLWGRETRESAWRVVTAFFAPKLFRWWLAMVFYIICWLFVFDRLGLWTPTLLKDAVFYVLFSATVTFFKANTISGEKDFFKEMLKDNLKFGVVVEFLTGEYTFSFVGELFLIPVLLLLAGMQAVASNDVKYASVSRLINWLWGVMGVWVLAYVGYSVTLHFRELLTLDKLRQILLTPNLTLVFIPFLYVLSLRMVYEVQFTLLGFSISDPDLLRFAKRKALRAFKTDLHGLERWTRRWNLSRPQTKDAILESISNVKEMQRMEKIRTPVPPECGWSPYEAKEFFGGEKLQGGYYEPSYNKRWMAASRAMDLDGSAWSSSMVYQVSGDRHASDRLELTLKVVRPNEAGDILPVFRSYCNELYLKSTGSALPGKILEQVLKTNSCKMRQGRYTIELFKERWHNTTHGYNLTFSVSVGRGGGADV